MRILALLACLIFSSLAPGPAMAQDPAPLTADLLEKLRAGGYLIFFRHSITPNYSDPDSSQLGNCATQRNLSAEGIAQAKAIGDAFRDLEIPVGIVRASPLCRCLDTATLAFGRHERDLFLRLRGSNPANDPDEAKAFRNIRNLAKIPPLPATNSVYISHGSIGAIFGPRDPIDEGEAVIVKPGGKDGWTFVAAVKSHQWVAP